MPLEKHGKLFIYLHPIGSVEVKTKEDSTKGRNIQNKVWIAFQNGGITTRMSDILKLGEMQEIIYDDRCRGIETEA